MGDRKFEPSQEVSRIKYRVPVKCEREHHVDREGGAGGMFLGPMISDVCDIYIDNFRFSTL